MDDAETAAEYRKRAAEYRKRAAELLQIAEVFKDRADRDEIMTLVAEWQHLADRAEARAKDNSRAR